MTLKKSVYTGLLALGLLSIGLADLPAQNSSMRFVQARGGLRMRSAPRTSAGTIKVIKNGQPVTLIREIGAAKVISGRRGRWTLVRWKGKKGWVFGGFLKRAGGKGVPVVRITSPANGWTTLKVVEVKGTIENAEGLAEAQFIFNGVTRYVPLNGGQFKQKVVLGSGSNYIKVLAANKKGVGSDNVKLMTNIGQMDVKVILSWDTDHTDVDLWVTDPRKEKVFYQHPRSKLGGTLDIDITDGFGPETFTLPQAAPGEYLVQVQYYGGKKPTMAKILVILFEGTQKEKRLTFPALLHKRGDGITIGRFKVN